MLFVLRDEEEKLDTDTLRISGKQVSKVNPLEVNAHLCYTVYPLKSCLCLLLILSCNASRQLRELCPGEMIHPYPLERDPQCGGFGLVGGTVDLYFYCARLLVVDQVRMMSKDACCYLVE